MTGQLHIPDTAERADLGAFTARVVRLDAASVVRLRGRGGRVDAWAQTPFDVLVTRSVRGEVDPADLTVAGRELLTALAVVRDERIDPGSGADAGWRSALPPEAGWRTVEEVPVEVLEQLAERGLALAREHGGPHGTPPPGLLDQTVLSAAGAGMRVGVALRLLLALSGMGFLGDGSHDRVRVSATDAWVRLDARFGAAVRRRFAALPLLPR